MKHKIHMHKHYIMYMYRAMSVLRGEWLLPYSDWDSLRLCLPELTMRTLCAKYDSRRNEPEKYITYCKQTKCHIAVIVYSLIENVINELSTNSQIKHAHIPGILSNCTRFIFCLTYAILNKNT